MNLLLSLILCVAMAVGGTGQLAAEPESMASWTVSNVSIGYGSETVELDKEAVLQGAVCEQEAQLHFQVNSGDQVMLPLAAKMNADELIISFSPSGRAYSFGNDVIMEYGEITDEEELKLIDDCAVYLTNLGRVLGNMHDPEYAQRVQDWSDAIDEMFFTEKSAAEVEIDGVLYPAEYRSGVYNDIKMMEAFGSVQITDLPELEAMVQNMESLLCLIEGVDIEKGFAGLMERYGVDADERPDTIMELTTMEQDGLKYTKSVSTTVDEENKTGSGTGMEVISRSDSTVYKMQTNSFQDKDVTAANLELVVSGPADAPTGMELKGEIKLFYDYSRPVEFGEEGEEYLSTEETLLELEMYSECIEGLWSTALNATGSTTYEYGSESDKLREEEPFELHFGCSEKNNAEGETYTSYSLVASFGADVLNLSFDVTRGSAPYADPFDQMQVYEADLEEENSAGQMLMMADIMAMSGNAMLLSAQDDIFAATQLLENIELYGEYVEVESIEAAKEYFEAPIPAFNPPAGYKLDKIEAAADGSCVDFYYWSDVEGESILVSYYDFRGQAKYHGIDEAQLEKGPIVHSEVVDGLVYYIDVFTPEVNVYFSVGGIRPEEADVLLKGLDVVSVYLDEDELAAREEAGKRSL